MRDQSFQDLEKSPSSCLIGGTPALLNLPVPTYTAWEKGVFVLWSLLHSNNFVLFWGLGTVAMICNTAAIFFGPFFFFFFVIEKEKG